MTNRAIIDPCFSAELNREAMRYLRGINAINTLNANLPLSVPALAEARLAQRPYLVELVWRRPCMGTVMTLRAKLNQILMLQNKWHSVPDADTPTIEMRTHLNVGAKDTVKVILRVEVESDDELA